MSQGVSHLALHNVHLGLAFPTDLFLDVLLSEEHLHFGGCELHI